MGQGDGNRGDSEKGERRRTKTETVERNIRIWIRQEIPVSEESLPKYLRRKGRGEATGKSKVANYACSFSVSKEEKTCLFYKSSGGTFETLGRHAKKLIEQTRKWKKYQLRKEKRKQSNGQRRQERRKRGKRRRGELSKGGCAKCEV